MGNHGGRIDPIGISEQAALTAADVTSRTLVAQRESATGEYLFSHGQVLGETYEIRDLLGVGGMSQVYEGRDLFLKRAVAIKAALPDLDPGLLRQEAEFLAAFRHPALVTVFAYGTERDVEYMVMERLSGRTLANHLHRRKKTGPFPLGEALDIFLAIAEGLAVLHNAGLVHRDLKPENIMLEPRGRVVLMDFGIMRTERTIGEEEIPTGTPEYMAPEAIMNRVAVGQAHLLDIYALGITAYEILVGRRPFSDPQVVRVLVQQLKSDAPTVRSQRGEVPRSLSRLVGEMLAKDPSDRPSGIELVTAELRAIRGGLSGSPQPFEISVLIADDDEDARELLAALVRQEHPEARIRFAGDGQEALELFLEEPPHLMILDLDMPRMNGLEVCMYLRGTKLGDRTTTMVFSAHASQNREALARLGVADVIAKKHDAPDRVAETVRAILGRIAMAQERRHSTHPGR